MASVRVRQAVTTSLAIAFVAGLGWVDYVTGPRWGLSLFYMAPVGVVAWTQGRVPSLTVAVIAALVWFVADVRWYREWAPSFWNCGTRLVTYCSLGYMLALLRDDRDRLRSLLEREQQFARTDRLTGLMNSRAFHERAASELSRSCRSGMPLALAFIDLDNFKSVNDRFGHAAGDDLLQSVGAALRSAVRDSDLCARLGGDEFAALLVDIPEDMAAPAADRILSAIERVTTNIGGGDVGASIGVAWFATMPRDVDELVGTADTAMYRAKTAGKHRVAIQYIGRKPDEQVRGSSRDAL